MKATRKGRSTHYSPGPGRFENLKVRVWKDARPGVAGEGRIVAEVKGTMEVYCGNGATHTTDIYERDVTWDRGAAVDALNNIVEAYRGDEVWAEEMVAEMTLWSLEDWEDPCEAE